MAELLIKSVQSSLAAKLRQRAKAHGLSEEQEAFLILNEALRYELLPETPAVRAAVTPPAPPAGELDDREYDWIFDRHDLRYGQRLLPAGEDFKAHLLALGEIAPDLQIEWPREVGANRPLDL